MMRNPHRGRPSLRGRKRSSAISMVWYGHAYPLQTKNFNTKSFLGFESCFNYVPYIYEKSIGLSEGKYYRYQVRSQYAVVYNSTIVF
eukprot:scaffold18208_cov182-Amphora_coffeaeformis.AAC.3